MCQLFEKGIQIIIENLGHCSCMAGIYPNIFFFFGGGGELAILERIRGLEKIYVPQNC